MRSVFLDDSAEHNLPTLVCMFLWLTTYLSSVHVKCFGLTWCYCADWLLNVAAWTLWHDKKRIEKHWFKACCLFATCLDMLGGVFWQCINILSICLFASCSALSSLPPCVFDIRNFREVNASKAETKTVLRRHFFSSTCNFSLTCNMDNQFSW